MIDRMAGTRDDQSASATLYRRILDKAYERMPEPLQRMHDLKDEMSAEGLAQVERGTNWLARFVATAMRFPEQGQNIPVRVFFRRQDGRETWRRTFGGRSFSNTQEEGQGRFEKLLCERFGPFAFGLALVLEEGRLKLVVRRWSVFGLPLPRALAPGGEAYEHAAGWALQLPC